MKKSKFIFGVATVLSLGIVATTVATYVSHPKDKVVTIGGTTSTNGTLTLTLVNNIDSSSNNPTIFEKVGDNVPGTVKADKLNETINPYNKLHARYALGVSGLADYKEPVIYGQITLTITTDFAWKDLNISAIVDGYSEDVKTDDENPGNQPSYMLLNDRNVLKENTPAESDPNTKVFHIDAPFSVEKETYGTQYLDLQVSLKDSAIQDYAKNGAEKRLSYNVSLVYPPSSAVEFPYLVGTPTGWQNMEDYRLYPNILATAEEFMIRDVEVEAGDEFKVKEGNEWSYVETDGNFTLSDPDKNAKANSAGKMNVFYTPADATSTPKKSYFALTPNQQ